MCTVTLEIITHEFLDTESRPALIVQQYICTCKQLKIKEKQVLQSFLQKLSQDICIFL